LRSGLKTKSNAQHFVIPAKAGKRAACGEFRGTAIQWVNDKMHFELLDSRFRGNDGSE
jgi:hypothetical protein